MLSVAGGGKGTGRREIGCRWVEEEKEERKEPRRQQHWRGLGKARHTTPIILQSAAPHYLGCGVCSLGDEKMAAIHHHHHQASGDSVGHFIYEQNLELSFMMLTK